jgi:hypothetical protein
MVAADHGARRGMVVENAGQPSNPENAAYLAEDEHARRYTQNVKTADLLLLTEAEIVERHDLLLSEAHGNSVIGADEYHAEFYRQAVVKDSQAFDDDTRRTNRGVNWLASIVAMPLVLDLRDLFELGDYVVEAVHASIDQPRDQPAPFPPWD